VPFRQVAMLQIGFAMAFLALSAAATHPFGSSSGVTRWSGALLAALLVTGVLATAVAFSVQTWAQQILPPANIAVILALEPVFAWLTAFLLMQERLQFRRAAGATLVLSGILSTELLQRWRGRTAAHPDPETPRAGPIATR
jgi:drug/metabolite transporter (DMT)-like permease